MASAMASATDAACACALPFYDMEAGVATVWVGDGQAGYICSDCPIDEAACARLCAPAHVQVESLLLIQRNWTEPPEGYSTDAPGAYVALLLPVDQPLMPFHLLVSFVNNEFMAGRLGLCIDTHGRACGDQAVRVANRNAREVHLFRANSRTHLATLHFGDGVAVDFGAPLRPVAPGEPLFVVPFDLAAFYVEATLYRKRDKGSYSLTEWIHLPRGTYRSVQALADALNATVQMRGERNGPVYEFTASRRKPVLRLCAHHRQPHPSSVHLWPASAFVGAQLGLPTDLVMVLGNKKYVDFEAPPAVLIADQALVPADALLDPGEPAAEAM